jgi:hypothetical protein
MIPVLFVIEFYSVLLDGLASRPMGSHMVMPLANHACMSESLALHTRVCVRSKLPDIWIFIVPLSSFGGQIKHLAHLFESERSPLRLRRLIGRVYRVHNPNSVRELPEDFDSDVA